jgi:hypothetical protein
LIEKAADWIVLQGQGHLVHVLTERSHQVLAANEISMFLLRPMLCRSRSVAGEASNAHLQEIADRLLERYGVSRESNIRLHVSPHHIAVPQNDYAGVVRPGAEKSGGILTITAKEG